MKRSGRLLKNAEIREVLSFLSLKAMGRTRPNPSVACLILAKNPYEIQYFSGATEAPGRRHAEIVAFDSLKESGFVFDELTVFVTLEPCSRYGRTPPCTLKFIEYKDKIRKVFIMASDPSLAEEGMNILRSHGVKTVCMNHSVIANSFLSGFALRIQEKRPRIHFKLANSKDGFIGKNNERTFITKEAALRVTMALRSRVDAVMIGPKTAAIDRAALNVRKFDIADTFQKVSGNDLFFHTLLKNIHEIEDTFSNLYQPDRIIILAYDFSGLKEYIRYQKSLEEETGKKTHFLFAGNELHNNSVDGTHIPSLRDKCFSTELRQYLAGAGFNEVLCEGGSGLIRALGFLPHDRYLEFISKSAVLNEGVRGIVSNREQLQTEFQLKQKALYESMEDLLYVHEQS